MPGYEFFFVLNVNYSQLLAGNMSGGMLFPQVRVGVVRP